VAGASLKRVHARRVSDGELSPVRARDASSGFFASSKRSCPRRPVLRKLEAGIVEVRSGLAGGEDVNE
jgi:hypothetical protein